VPCPAWRNIRIRLVPTGQCRLTTPHGPDGVAAFEGCFGRSPLVLGRNVIDRLRLYFATGAKEIYYIEQPAAPGPSSLALIH
jgi:hypothetical protein